MDDVGLMGISAATEPLQSCAPFSWRQRALMTLLFASVDLCFFCTCTSGADVANYFDYAQQWDTGSLRSLYDPTVTGRVVEYPPLAIGLIRLVDLAAHGLPEQAALYDRISLYEEPMGAPPRYHFAYRLLMALLALMIFMALLGLVDRYFDNETRLERLERLSVFLIGVCCLATSVFDRLDLVLGALILLAAVLVVGGRHWLWSAAVLAAAIGFKVTPVVLVPFWALATVPREWFAELSSARAWGRLALGLLVRFGAVAAMTVAVCFPFYHAAGPGCLSFFKYHADRGIECESTYAAVLAVLGQLGQEVGCSYNYGAFEMEGACAPQLTRAAPFVVGVPLLLVIVAYFYQLRREARGDAGASLSEKGSGLVAGTARGVLRTTSPDPFLDRRRLGLVGPMLLALLIFLLGNKVLSPQYFMWVLPLAPLVPFSGWARRWLLIGFALVYVLTVVVFPVAGTSLIGDWSPPERRFDRDGPDLLGALILSARSLAMLAVAVGLAVALFRPRPAARAAALPAAARAG